MDSEETITPPQTKNIKPLPPEPAPIDSVSPPPLPKEVDDVPPRFDKYVKSKKPTAHSQAPRIAAPKEKPNPPTTPKRSRKPIHLGSFLYGAAVAGVVTSVGVWLYSHFVPEPHAMEHPPNKDILTLIPLAADLYDNSANQASVDDIARLSARSSSPSIVLACAKIAFAAGRIDDAGAILQKGVERGVLPEAFRTQIPDRANGFSLFPEGAPFLLLQGSALTAPDPLFLLAHASATTQDDPEISQAAVKMASLLSRAIDPDELSRIAIALQRATQSKVAAIDFTPRNIPADLAVASLLNLMAGENHSERASFALKKLSQITTPGMMSAIIRLPDFVPYRNHAALAPYLLPAPPTR